MNTILTQLVSNVLSTYSYNIKVVQTLYSTSHKLNVETCGLNFYFKIFWIYFVTSISKIVSFYYWILKKLLFLYTLPCLHPLLLKKVRVFWTWLLECGASTKKFHIGFFWDPDPGKGSNLTQVSLFFYFKLNQFSPSNSHISESSDSVFSQGIAQCDTLRGSNSDACGDLCYPPNTGLHTQKTIKALPSGSYSALNDQLMQICHL